METVAQTKELTKDVKIKDAYQRVTDIIIEQLEAGVIPWEKPWAGASHKALSLPYNFTTKNFYQGMNIILLWCSAVKNNFPTNEWAGYYQWNQRNEFIKKDEQGSLIIYYDTVEKEVEGEVKKLPFLKTYKVFNRSQLASYVPGEANQEPTKSLIEKIDVIDDFLAHTHAIIEQHDGGPCYDLVSDKILMPYPETFQDTKTCSATEAFYSSTMHELVHWTGARNRLNREGGKRFGDQQYALEELVAEFGAAFLSAGFGLATVEKGDHAGYIDHWLKVIKENNRSIFIAASEASKAVDYLNNIQPK
ncbi:DUF1738 domain-containing protein [Mucilaginibacter sp. BJC16-A38]|uniref:ArdC family protein n=1 Tax=Mucilaginibacter phenanthrenivorans TaxID=1234842 RepID=UPI0021580BA1|nr:zincin-like metallopeptidase domain-containing protein [Mucilaginibacter phenanthrenivorans]MCR8561045.1 DUF1738 domain-containing protein [Mucilaginibacter phenanthrenivorans]